MSKREIEQVCTLAAHLAKRLPGDFREHGFGWSGLANRCATDAMRLQRLGRRARRNGLKNWIPPDKRKPGETVDVYLQECARIGGEVARVVSPYGWHPRDFVVGSDGITILALPGDHAAVFGKGFLI